jgi:hypothetical protein
VCPVGDSIRDEIGVRDDDGCQSKCFEFDSSDVDIFGSSAEFVGRFSVNASEESLV